MALTQTNLEAARGQTVSTVINDTGNSATTLTIAAGGVGTVVRLLHLICTSSVAASAADSTVTIKPDASTAPYVEDLTAARGLLLDRTFPNPILGKDNTAFTIVLGALGGTSVGRVTAVYDYRGYQNL